VEGRRGVSRFASRSDRKEIEDSLRQLRTDVIDLYQVHWPDLETPIAETARTLEDLRGEGKIRAIGVSNYAPAQMNTFRAVAKLDAVQPPYNLFEREIEADVLPYAKGAGLTVLSYGALCRGLLSGSMSAKTTLEGDDLRKVDRNHAPAKAVATDMHYGVPLSPPVRIADGDYGDLAGAGLAIIAAGVNEKAGGATDRTTQRGGGACSNPM
jgi:aryl-alcohol dehydrogenase-like predicted oxidoreductase